MVRDEVGVGPSRLENWTSSSPPPPSTVLSSIWRASKQKQKKTAWLNLLLVPPPPGRFEFANFLWFLLPVSQSSYFAFKKTWEKCQTLKLKTAFNAKWPVLLCKIMIFREFYHFYYIKWPSFHPNSFYSLDLIFLPDLFTYKIRWSRPREQKYQRKLWKIETPPPTTRDPRSRFLRRLRPGLRWGKGRVGPDLWKVLKNRLPAAILSGIRKLNFPESWPDRSCPVKIKNCPISPPPPSRRFRSCLKVQLW